MRFHVVSLPHTNTTEDYSSCAFTEKVRKFCIMMKNLGHTVYLYAGEKNEAPCDEFITCVYESERLNLLNGLHYTQSSFDMSHPTWRIFNSRASHEVSCRKQPKDFLCLIGGLANKPIADHNPEMMCVEFGIGYPGTFAKYKVYESYAWMHTCYGAAKGDPSHVDGTWFDDVIPSYFEPEKFPFKADKGDYYLYMGRMVDRKGYAIAQHVCKLKGARLILAGPTEPVDNYGEYFGMATPTQRGELMSNAKALFVPTIYIEPFGSVGPEAMLCGTPVISTDWGAMTETVINGVSGYRCRTLQDFYDAMDKVLLLDPKTIRDYAVANYSLDAVAKRYDVYFNRLLTLWEDGWYSIKEKTNAVS